MNYWLIQSKTDSKSVRIVQAKNKNAARQHVYGDLWNEPKKAGSEDFALAMNSGVKVEVCGD